MPRVGATEVDVAEEIEADAGAMEDRLAQEEAEERPNSPTKSRRRQHNTLQISSSPNPVLDGVCILILGWSRLGSRLSKCKNY